MLSLHYSMRRCCSSCLMILLVSMFVNADEEIPAPKITMVEAENDQKEDECGYSMLQFIDFKMLLVGCIGSSVALISIAHNLLLFYTFVSSSLLRRRNLTYLTCLSLCDIFVGISYLGIMSVQVYAEYFQILPLYILWHNYLNIAFTVSNITLTTASFLLVAATFERYLQTIRMGSGKLLRFVSRHRLMGVMLSFTGGIIFRGSVFFEIEVFHKPECQGFASTGVSLSEIVMNPFYDIWRFWIRRIMTIFVPFFVLAYCNAAIVYSLRENQRDKMIKTLILYMTMGHGGEITRLRSRVRAATRMLIIVVSCYLCANIIDVIIAFLEYTMPEVLGQYEAFYTVATDVSSLLSALSSALRLPIYIANDKLIRLEVLRKVRKLYYGCFCCSSKQNAKRKAFESEKRRLVYEQIEQATSTPPALNAHAANRMNSKISVDSSKIRNGIGSLIIARASVVSAMHDSIGINYDMEKCAALYARAVARRKSRQSSSSSFEDSFAHNVVCENPEGPNGFHSVSFLDARKISFTDNTMPPKLKKKISAPPKLSQDLIVVEVNDSISDYEVFSTKDEKSTANTPVPLKRNCNDKGDVLYWSSNI